MFVMCIGYVWLSETRLLMHPDLYIPGTSTRIYIIMTAHSEPVYYWIKRARWSWLFLDFLYLLEKRSLEHRPKKKIKLNINLGVLFTEQCLIWLEELKF